MNDHLLLHLSLAALKILLPHSQVFFIFIILR